MSTASYLRDLDKEAKRLGYTISMTNNNHLRLTHPRVSKPIFASGTPGDRRVLNNIISKMSRMLRNSERTTL